MLTTLSTACRDAEPTTLELSDDSIVLTRIDTVWSGQAFVGTVAASRVARVRAENSGSLLTVSVDAGQFVAAGAVLATFDDRGIRDQLQVAAAALAQADATISQVAREMERVEALIAIGAIAVRERELAQRNALAAQLQQAEARARVANAEHLLQRTVIRAPFDAIVMDQSARAGDVVAAGTPLFTLADNNQLSIEAFLPVSTASTVAVGAEVHISPMAERSLGEQMSPIHRRSARIRTLSRMVDPQTRQVRMSITSPVDGPRLLIGQTVQGRLALGARVGIHLSERAIDHTDDTPMVALIRQGQIVRAPVTLGERDGDSGLVEILTGLTPGDSIVTGDARRTADGVTVRARHRAPTDTPASSTTKGV